MLRFILTLNLEKVYILLMKKILMVGFLINYGFSVFAQQTVEVDTALSMQQLLNELKGTYELKYTGRMLPVLPSNLAEIIEQNRKETVLTVIKLNEQVELVIYPGNSVANNRLRNKE